MCIMSICVLCVLGLTYSVGCTDNGLNAVMFLDVREHASEPRARNSRLAKRFAPL